MPCGGDLFMPDHVHPSLAEDMQAHPERYDYCNYCQRRANGGKDETRKCMGFTGWDHLKAALRSPESLRFPGRPHSVEDLAVIARLTGAL
jgi:hypothetical protein